MSDNTTNEAIQIIPYYSQPHVHTVINDNTWYDESVGTIVEASDSLPYTTVVVTGADKGIANQFVKLSDLQTKKAIFGRGNYQKYGQSSLQADALFNGQTNVWFMRVLPDNATYANIIYLAHYRKGNILDDLSQETGLKRMEIKFSCKYAAKPDIVNGAADDTDILGFARACESSTADPQTGYLTVPLFYVRSIGQGKYGNSYSVAVNRDYNAEKEYGTKMFKWTLIDNTVTAPVNEFSGSLVQSSNVEVSTLISDVLDQYSAGSCPISIYPFEDSFSTLYNFYRDIVNENAEYIANSGAASDLVEELEIAEAIDEDTFDPLFGYVQDTRNDEIIPYYKNYTEDSSNVWVEPTLTVTDASRPVTTDSWTTATVGARVLVTADPLNDGKRWMYTVVSIDDFGSIMYDEGESVEIDADQYTGVNVSSNVGLRMYGGSDGDFESITVNGVTRAPSSAEMKILLSREYVKAFRGAKDRRILSPARMDLDFIFDANYNLCDDDDLVVDSMISSLYHGSTVLTDYDSQELSVLGSNTFTDYSDINVKSAMYDLVQFRNRNGMAINPEDPGAGCSLYLDCGLVGLKSIDVNNELEAIITMMTPFEGRFVSVDFGYYEIYDPMSKKRIKVTAAYMLATKLVNHLIKFGLNKPFTYNYAQLTAIQRTSSLSQTGDMIRGSFKPSIDLIDWDVKEKLYKSRINYYVVAEEGRLVQRAVQNTRQMDASALLEENNVRVLNTLKKGLEKACRGYMYEWNEPTVRKGYTKAQMDIYRPWIGTMVQDLDITFDANDWETERMIMHCYVSVKFRNIVKRIILEININRPDNSSDGGES